MYVCMHVCIVAISVFIHTYILTLKLLKAEKSYIHTYIPYTAAGTATIVVGVGSYGRRQIAAAPDENRSQVSTLTQRMQDDRAIVRPACDQIQLLAQPIHF